MKGAAPEAKVTRWQQEDSYDDAAPAPSVRTRLGRPLRLMATGGVFRHPLLGPLLRRLGFIPVLFIAYAFRELNSAMPDCGTTFFWARRAFGPWAGWRAAQALRQPA